MDKDKAFEVIKEKDIKYILLQFTDSLNKLYSLWVPPAEVESSLEEGIGVSGWPYFVPHENSDVVLMPDMQSFRVLPWNYNGRNVSMVMCDVRYADRPEEIEEVPRTLLKRAVKKLKAEIGENVNLYVAPEGEYFLVKRDENGQPRLPKEGSYLVTPPGDFADELREAICHALTEMDVKVYKQHHEALRGKHEIDIEYDEAIRMADKTQIYRMVVRKLASERDLIATFMPRPFNVPGGAGWHTHVSIMDEKDKTSLFYSDKGEYGLSDLALHFMAGVLKHARALAAISNSSVNSYKRLVPGLQAPTNICWAKNNRSTLIRIPASSPKATRFEYRASDGLCNYYLFFAALIYAGLDGIAKGELPPPPTECDVYALTAEEKKQLGIKNMPGSLGEALEALKEDEVIKGALEPLTPKFLQLKEAEWRDYSYTIHEWERKRYMEEFFTLFADFNESGDRIVG